MDTLPTRSKDAAEARLALRNAGKHIVNDLVVWDKHQRRVGLLDVQDAISNRIVAVYYNLLYRAFNGTNYVHASVLNIEITDLPTAPPVAQSRTKTNPFANKRARGG